MSNFHPTEQELLTTILEPLLEDFRYWFSRARTLLETETIPFLSQEEQTDLLNRVIQSQQEVASAVMLFKSMEAKVGIDMAVLMPWHQLVTECWQVAMRFRAYKQQNNL
ncbi:MAG: DUF2605 domain-containing protein [Snowella sp.]|nr:DUF2605 domain-containing protein [Snowella sp.]